MGKFWGILSYAHAGLHGSRYGFDTLVVPMARDGVMAKRKLTDIEDQALSVYRQWFIHGTGSEGFQCHLNGMFEMLKKEFPKETDEALNASAPHH
jgi:hypothetical protein